MNKLTLIHVIGSKPSVTDKIISSLQKAFAINYIQTNVDTYKNVFEENTKIHLVIFDDIDESKIKLNRIHKVKDRNKHAHFVLTSNEVEERKLISIYRKQIDRILPQTYTTEYYLTVLRQILNRMSSKYVIAKEQEYLGLKVDRATREVFFGGKALDFTGREYKILQRLIDAHGVPFKKDEMFKQVWKYDEDTSRVLDQYLHRIKKKLAKYDLETKVIKNKGIILRKKEA